MGRIVVCGAGVVGLAAAMMLARDGHDVTVLEADSQVPPDVPVQAWEQWRRRGVAQFRQPHNMLARFRQVCDEELPGVTERLLAAGCVWVDYLGSLLTTLTDRVVRAGDERLRLVTGRRPVTEAVFAIAAGEQPGVTIRRGVRVAGLRSGPSARPGVPHVAGVRTAEGEDLAADLVIDATGRRTPSSGWLTELGASAPHVQSADSGFAYYTRYYTGPHRPRRRGPALMPVGSLSILTLDADNDTWSVTLFGQSGDAPLKALRDADVFSRVVRACPLQADWLDGTPITNVLAMAGVLDQYRRFVIDGRPVVTGFAAVGDAWACTNPSAGRGMSVGLVHAQRLRAVVRDHLADPAAFAAAWDEETQEHVTPFYRNQLAADRVRLAEMDALRTGADLPTPDPITSGLFAAANHDADALRALLETILCLAHPQEVLQRPAVKEAIATVKPLTTPLHAPGPNRTQLLTLLSS